MATHRALLTGCGAVGKLGGGDVGQCRVSAWMGATQEIGFFHDIMRCSWHPGTWGMGLVGRTESAGVSGTRGGLRRLRHMSPNRITRLMSQQSEKLKLFHFNGRRNLLGYADTMICCSTVRRRTQDCWAGKIPFRPNDRLFHHYEGDGSTAALFRNHGTCRVLLRRGERRRGCMIGRLLNALQNKDRICANHNSAA
jgi:hypothetical protein